MSVPLMRTKVDDSYPTRIEGEPTPIDRFDPTVWGEVADGPMDAATLAAHDSRGYSVVEGMLSAREITAYWQELVRLSSEFTEAASRPDERVITERDSGEVRSVFEVHHSSELIAELVTDPRILDRARQILGSEVYVHQSRVNYMPGFRGTGFYWHSDFETWHAEDGMPVPRAVSCSIALADNHAYNGGLMIMPGSQRTFLPCTGPTPPENYLTSLQRQQVGVPDEDEVSRLAADCGIEQFTGSAGSALFFDSNLMHGSGNNITPFPRSNIFLVFNSVDNALGDPYAAERPRPEFIASRDFTPVRR